MSPSHPDQTRQTSATSPESQRRQSSALQKAPDTPAESSEGTVTGIPADNRPINILLVDDEPKNLTALETVLDDPRYRLVRAVSADEALLALVADEFALLILDIQMPGMNGFELAHMIKQRRKTAGVPIIFLTAYYSEDEHALAGYSTGAVDFLTKPINPAILRSKVSVFAALYQKTREAVLANRALLAEIAERRNAEEQLRELNSELERRVDRRTAALTESEARFRALAEEMPHFVWEMDATGRPVYHNARWQAYAGPSTARMGDDWLNFLHPDDVARMTEAWTNSLKTGNECDVHCRYRRALDGTYRWFRVKAAPIRDYAGRIIRWVATSTDIDEQRHAEEALREADKRKDEFLAMLGHELRNPLAAIHHAIRAERESADTSTTDWAREVIERQSDQLTRMVNDLLDVARINSGRVQLHREVLNLQAVLERAVAVVRPLIDEKGHALATEIADGLWIFGDASRLEQIFVNILNNAAKYTQKGGAIQLSAKGTDAEAVISIRDNGLGISAEMLPHVFELFTQADSSLDRAQGGLGIGLTVVKSLTEMHGGNVEAESAPSSGSTFTVRLPLRPEPGTTAEAVTSPVAPDALQNALRVLIVDDLVDSAEALARLLSRRNCEVRVAHDGPSGLTAAREFGPDVLLLDLGLPGLNGFDIARTLRAEPAFANTLFIAISGYAQQEDRERSLAAGFDLHFAKPVDIATLLEAMRERVQPKI